MHSKLITLSIAGYFVAFLINLFYFITSINLTHLELLIVLVLGVLSLFLLVTALGLKNRKKWAYKLAIVLSALSLISLIPKPDLVEIIIVLSGILLFIDRKNFVAV